MQWQIWAKDIRNVKDYQSKTSNNWKKTETDNRKEEIGGRYCGATIAAIVKYNW